MSVVVQLASIPVLLCLGAAACSGTIGGGSGLRSDESSGGHGESGDVGSQAGSSGTTGTTDENGLFTSLCSPDAVYRELPLKRLSQRQYTNAVKAAVATLLPAQSKDVLNEIDAELVRFPEDHALPPDSFGAMGFRRSDQFLTQDRANRNYAVADALATAVSANSVRVQALFGACATDTARDNDVACAIEGLRRWGPRLLRAPLNADDLKFYASPADPARGGSNPARGFGEVVGLVLASPPFVFQVEGGNHDPDAPAAQLTAFELASRLSFQLTDAPPDGDLWARAQDGSLLDASVFDAQVDRLAATPAAAQTRDLFVDEWLGLSEHTPDPLLRVATSLAWAAYTKNARPPQTARTEMIDDVLAMSRSVFDSGQPVSALITNRQAFARGAWLAGIYGTTPWDGQGEAPTPGGERAGLLTRPALTASGEVDTRPIMKGVRIRTALLCDSIPGPPPGAAGTKVEKDAVLTTRERYRQLTEAENTPCRTCHSDIINPLGFVTENFDGLGRLRTQEVVFSEAGLELASIPVEIQTTYYSDTGETLAVADAGQMTAAIVRKFETCVATQYFRFASAKAQQGPSDGCPIAAMATVAQAQDGSAAGMIKAFFKNGDFRRRVFEQQGTMP